MQVNKLILSLATEKPIGVFESLTLYIYPRFESSALYENIELFIEKGIFFVIIGANFVISTKMKFSKKMPVNSDTIELRPRYVETDQGGVVHHSVMAIYFEMGRTELLRANGVSYKDMEANGVYFVVTELNIKYRKPVFYDDILELTTSRGKVGSCRIDHIYELKRKKTGILVAQGFSTLVCMDGEGNIRRLPEFMHQA